MKGFDRVSQRLIEKALSSDQETFWQRLEKQSPQCGFGQLGTCCRMCYMGPCRIDPFGEGPTVGVCGATADTIVARNLLREAVGGAASHVGHARHVVLALKKALEGKASYQISDKAKLMEIAQGLGLETEGQGEKEIAKEIIHKALEDISSQDGSPMNWLKFRAPRKEYENWEKLGLLVSNAHNEIEEAMHRTSMGNDADPVNLLLAVLRMGITDGYGGLHVATDFHDLLFGTPKVGVVEANVGVLDKEKVNIAMHGHNPVLSEKILEWALKLEGEAREAGAQGINVVGVCCTGNELTMRHNVPLAAHNLQAELLLHTGVVDAMVVDMQCIWPVLAKVAACYGTRFITTESFVKIPGAIHIPFEAETADEEAKKIVSLVIEAFRERKGKEAFIPQEKSRAVVGFSVEAILEVLKKIEADDPLKPVIENIAQGNIYGVVGFAGCPNPKLRNIALTEKMMKALVRNNVLVVATGCTAHIAAQRGLMSPEATERYAGEGLKKVLYALGEVAGLEGALPPVWHMGSCVDNSRIGTLLGALAERLGVRIAQLPVAGSAPELITEKAVAIGSWFLALGLMVHVAPPLRILGSPVAVKVLTEDLEKITGGKLYLEADPEKAVSGILEHIEKKRKGLGL